MSWREVGSGLFASNPANIEAPVRVVVGLQAIVALMREPEGDQCIVVTNVAGGSAVSTIIRRAKAIVSTIGGPNSHIVIVARDYSVPCVVGVSGLDLGSLANGTRMRLHADGRVEVDETRDSLPPIEALRLLRLIAFAGAFRHLDDIVGFGDGNIATHLNVLRNADLVETGDLITLTPAGLIALEAWYGRDRSARALENRSQFLDNFRPLDRELKHVARLWQDAASRDNWDARIQAIEALTTLHNAAIALISSHAASYPRFLEFRDRLTLAHSKLLDGETDYFVGVNCDSYHTVWFQFHEDLLRLFQRQRDKD